MLKWTHTQKRVVGYCEFSLGSSCSAPAAFFRIRPLLNNHAPKAPMNRALEADPGIPMRYQPMAKMTEATQMAPPAHICVFGLCCPSYSGTSTRLNHNGLRRSFLPPVHPLSAGLLSPTLATAPNSLLSIPAVFILTRHSTFLSARTSLGMQTNWDRVPCQPRQSD